MVYTPLALSDASRGAIVVTGASTGIGRACVLSLDAMGFRVLAGVRKSEDGESLGKANSSRLAPIFIDVTDEQPIATAAAGVARAVGDAGLAGLVNNAGVAIPGPLEYLPLEELRRQLEINLVGQLAVIRGRGVMPSLAKCGWSASGRAHAPALRQGRARLVVGSGEEI